jgi:hypothetical protein
MACFHPLKAFRTAGGEIIFNSHRADTVADLKLPCGQCIGCRLERSRQWAMRCMHESSLHKQNCFLTLTYAPEHLPTDGSLNYEDYQLFMKRLRKRFNGTKIRFYMCGEYGSKERRPHYHAIVFGFDLPDRKFLKKTHNGDSLYTSEILDEVWGLGHCFIGDVTFKSAAYVARYIMKKVTGEDLDPDTGLSRKFHYYSGDGTWLKPEFTKMSLKPGIGKPWLDKFKCDVYPHDYVIVNGKKVKPPKYYDKIYSESDPFDFEDLQYQRFLRSREKLHDNTPERLLVRKEVLEAKLSKLKRSLEESI